MSGAASLTTTGSIRPRYGRRQRVFWFAEITVGLLMLGTAVYSFVAYLTQSEGATSQLVVAIFSAYLFVECRRYLMRTDAFGLLAPPLLASIAHFLLNYLLPTAATTLDPWIHSRFEHYLWSMHEQIPYTLILVGISAFSMWRGYYFGRRTAGVLRAQLVRWSVIRKRFEPHLAVAAAMQVGYLVVVSYAISLGVFGISSSAQTREVNLAILDYITLGMTAGALSFLLLMCHLFRRLETGKGVLGFRAAAIGIVFMHLVIAALSGFKSQLVMPFVMLALAKFLVTRRISLAYIVSGVLALVLAYQVVEPFRAYLAREQLYGQSDIVSLFTGLQRSYEQRDLDSNSDVPLGTQIAQRFDLTAMAAIGIEFADREQSAVSKAREMRETLYLAPLLAYVPRALWPSKPLYETGGWFNTVVLGNPIGTSVGMGPQAWLYLAGGIAGIVAGFFCIGWLQAILFDGFARAGPGGIIIFLAAANVLILLPTEVGPSFVGILRILPIAFLAQFVLLRAPLARHR